MAMSNFARKGQGSVGIKAGKAHRPNGNMPRHAPMVHRGGNVGVVIDDPKEANRATTTGGSNFSPTTPPRTEKK
jgi:hypothetical protein